MLERINPKQGFQNTSNVSATLLECKKKKSPLRNVKACTAFITTSFKLKDCGEDGERQGEARARGGSEMTERCEPLETNREHCPKEPQWERPHARCEPVSRAPRARMHRVRNQRWDRIKVKEKQLSRTKHKGFQDSHMSLKKEKSERKPHSLARGFHKESISQVESYKRAIFLSC